MFWEVVFGLPEGVDDEIIIIIIINPLPARIVEAPRMILQPVFSIFSPLISTALWDLPNSRPDDETKDDNLCVSLLALCRLRHCQEQYQF